MNNISKVIIISRHGNRESWHKIPIFENGMRGFNHTTLTKIGYENSKILGRDLKNYHLNDIKLLTTSAERCINTAKGIAEGLNISFSYTINDSMINGFGNYLPRVSLNSKEIDYMYNEYLDFMNQVEEELNLDKHYSLFTNSTTIEKCTALYDVYFYHTALICYRDKGFSIDKFSSILNELNVINIKIMNYFNQIFQETFGEHVEKIIKDLSDNKNEMVIYVSHDMDMFLMIKYLANKYNKNKEYHPPYFLSTIRFETMNDGEERIYYDDIRLN